MYQIHFSIRSNWASVSTMCWHPHSNIRRRIHWTKRLAFRTATSMTMTPIYSTAMAIFSVVHQSVSALKCWFNSFAWFIWFTWLKCSTMFTTFKNVALPCQHSITFCRFVLFLCVCRWCCYWQILLLSLWFILILLLLLFVIVTRQDSFGISMRCPMHLPISISMCFN